MEPETAITIIQNCIENFDSLYLEIGSSFEQLNNQLNEFFNFVDCKVRAIHIDPYPKTIHGGVKIVSIESSYI